MPGFNPDISAEFAEPRRSYWWLLGMVLIHIGFRGVSPLWTGADGSLACGIISSRRRRVGRCLGSHSPIYLNFPCHARSGRCAYNIPEWMPSGPNALLVFNSMLASSASSLVDGITMDIFSGCCGIAWIVYTVTIELRFRSC